jgi:DNA-binding HxlR family transcriptional regulator
VYHETVELIGSRWTGAILWVLMSGPMRFSAIVDAVPGMSDRLCCSRLRELETAGLVDRRVMTGRPGGVEYRLTRAGRDLESALAALARWGHRWLRAHPSDAGAFHLPQAGRGARWRG